MLRHLVLAKSARADEVAGLFARAARLAASLPGVRHAGVASDRGELNRGYRTVLVLDFDDATALTRYLEHPDHDPIRDALLDRAEMIVLDLEVGQAPG
jgi:hypothetical protein